MTEQVEQVPTIGISLQTQMPNGQALVLQCFVPRDSEKAELNTMLDKLRVASERQLAFGGIREAKDKLNQQEAIAASHARRIELTDHGIKEHWEKSGRKGDVRLSQQERHQQIQAYQYAEDTKQNIANLKKLISELERVTQV